MVVVRVTLPESTFSVRSWSGWPPMSGESGSAWLKKPTEEPAMVRTQRNTT